MDEIEKNAPREDKNDWRLQKFHHLLHIVRDINNYGSPSMLMQHPIRTISLTLKTWKKST